MNDFENGDEVWDLLGRSRPVASRPFFAAKVVRAAKVVDAERWPGWLVRGLRLPLPAFALGILTVIALVSLGQPQVESDILPYYGVEAAALEFEAVANLDHLLGMSEVSGWAQ